MVEIVLAAIALGVTLSFMVGPVFLLLLEMALTRGVKKAIIFDAGVVLADIVFISVLMLGSSFMDNTTYVSWIYAIGGLLIVAFGLHNIRSSMKKMANWKANEEVAPIQIGPWYLYFIKGFFMNFLNMGVLAYWLTCTIVVRASVENDEKSMLVYFVVTVLTYFIVDIVKILFARRLKQYLTPKFLINIERVVGLVLIGLGLFMMIRGYLHYKGFDLNQLIESTF